MNVIKNIILFIKNIFNKQESIKALDAPKPVVITNIESDFIKSIRITSIPKGNRKIETLIHEGNGLGIQKKISS